MTFSSNEQTRSNVGQQSVNGIYNEGCQPDLTNGVTNDTRKASVAVVFEEHAIDTDHKRKGDKQCDDAGEDSEIFCGVGSFRPSFMQCCNNMAAFSGIFSASGLITTALFTYILSQITTLEKQFNFSSSVSGVLISCNDFGYLATTLFMSYYTRQIHIPRSMAMSTILFGVSGILCAVAFFGTRDQLPSPPKTNEHVSTATQSFITQTCHTTPILTNHSCTDASGRQKTPSGISDYWKQVAIVIIAVSMILQGIAKAPRQPFVLTYLDDNLARTKTSLYFGIIIGVSFFGSTVAFGCGSLFSNMYITLEETSITPRDPRWLGAWWLGFVIFGAVCLVVGIPLICFPKRMRNQKNMDIAKPRKNVDQKQIQKLCHDFKGMLKSVLHMVLNPLYVCLVLANSVNMMGIIGMFSFFNKYLEIQFTLTAAESNLTFGIVNAVVACIGIAAGGCMTTRLKLSPLSCLKFIIGVKIVYVVILALELIVGCDQPDLLNINRSVNESLSQCVLGCNCDDTDYFPVCGNDGISYFSPCHAGCLSAVGTEFTSCSCLATNGNQTATGGLCKSDCKTLYPYLVLFCIVAFLTAMASMPTYIVCMRCVKEDDKPFAVGFAAFIETLIGWFPGPIIFGGLVDSACMLWKTTCGTIGACALYDTAIFRFRFHALAVGLGAITLLLYIISLILALCSKKAVFLPQIDDTSATFVAEHKDNDLVHKMAEGDSDVQINTESANTYI